MDYMQFGEKLKELRKYNKISQKELAKELNIGQVMISYYERGLSKPSIDLVKSIAEYFKVPLSDFINSTGEAEEVHTQLELAKIYIELYKYNIRTEGTRLKCCNNEINEEYDFFNEQHKFYKRVWFKIKGITTDNKTIDIGYIIGYYINAKKVYNEFDMWGDASEELASDFCYGTELIQQFYDEILINEHQVTYRSESLAKQYLGDFYYLNNLYITNDYYSEELEKLCLLELKRGLKENFNMPVENLVYSIGFTEITDPTEKDTSYNIYNRQKRNLNNLGFEQLLKNDIYSSYRTTGGGYPKISIAGRHDDAAELYIWEDDKSKQKKMMEINTKSIYSEIQDIKNLEKEYSVRIKRYVDNGNINLLSNLLNNFLCNSFIPEIIEDIEVYKDKFEAFNMKVIKLRETLTKLCNLNKKDIVENKKYYIGINNIPVLILNGLFEEECSQGYFWIKSLRDIFNEVTYINSGNIAKENKLIQKNLEEILQFDILKKYNLGKIFYLNFEHDYQKKSTIAKVGEMKICILYNISDCGSKFEILVALSACLIDLALAYDHINIKRALQNLRELLKKRTEYNIVKSDFELLGIMFAAYILNSSGLDSLIEVKQILSIIDEVKEFFNKTQNTVQ